MTQTKKDEANVAKGVLVGAAVVAGVVAAIALKDEKTRKKVSDSLTDIRKKGMELKTKVKKLAKDNFIENDMGEKLMEKNPAKS